MLGTSSSIFRFSSVYIRSAASVVGKSEAQGPLGDCFDLHDDTDRFGKSTWEAAESEMQRLAMRLCLAKAEQSANNVGLLLAGDLLNQCVGSAYGLLDYPIPYIGLYGACSTAAEGLMLGAMAVSAGFTQTAAAVTSSHNSSAERQYRFPVEYGGQRSPTAQWTVTGSGAFLLGKDSGGVRVSAAMPGIVRDCGITDVSNMGAAMAPAAVDTLLRFLRADGSSPEDLDLILTGDLGREGSLIFKELLAAEGISLGDRHNDCGLLIYDLESQDMHAGGSGCGCSAVVTASYILPRLERGEYRRVLLLGTGAMMSPAIIQQGQSIPGIAHAVLLESNGGREI